MLSKGKVVEQGTHEELMALGKEYYHLVMAQVKTNETVEASKKTDTKDVVQIEDEDEQKFSLQSKAVDNWNVSIISSNNYIIF